MSRSHVKPLADAQEFGERTWQSVWRQLEYLRCLQHTAEYLKVTCRRRVQSQPWVFSCMLGMWHVRKCWSKQMNAGTSISSRVVMPVLREVMSVCGISKFCGGARKRRYGAALALHLSDIMQHTCSTLTQVQAVLDVQEDLKKQH